MNKGYSLIDLGHDPNCTCTACAQLVLRYGEGARASRALSVTGVAGDTPLRPLAKAQPRGPALWQRAIDARRRVRLKKALEDVIVHLATSSPDRPRHNRAVLAYLRRQLDLLEERGAS